MGITHWRRPAHTHTHITISLFLARLVGTRKRYWGGQQYPHDSFYTHMYVIECFCLMLFRHMCDFMEPPPFPSACVSVFYSSICVCTHLNNANEKLRLTAALGSCERSPVASSPKCISAKRTRQKRDVLELIHISLPLLKADCQCECLASPLVYVCTKHIRVIARIRLILENTINYKRNPQAAERVQ